jgi:two-component sensor histidine kinase
MLELRGTAFRTNPRRTLNFIVAQRTFVEHEMTESSDPDRSLLLRELDHRIKNELT